jgi:hypothetical protein
MIPVGIVHLLPQQQRARKLPLDLNAVQWTRASLALVASASAALAAPVKKPGFVRRFLSAQSGPEHRAPGRFFCSPKE